MRGAAAVGVDNDLSACQAGVALRSADDEASGRIDIDLCLLIQQFCRHSGFDHQVDHIPADLLQLRLRGVLGRDHDGVHAHRPSLLVILDGDLGLSVRPEVVHKPLLADLRQALGQLMRQGDCKRHLFRRLIAGIAEHHALVPCSADLVVGAQRDITGLLVDVHDDAAGVAVETVLGCRRCRSRNRTWPGHNRCRGLHRGQPSGCPHSSWC